MRRNLTKWFKNNAITVVSVIFLAGVFYATSNENKLRTDEQIDELSDEIVLLKAFREDQEALNINLLDRVRNNTDNLNENRQNIMLVRCSLFGSGSEVLGDPPRIRLLQKLGDWYVLQGWTPDSSIDVFE